jgi:hypothetical protein
MDEGEALNRGIVEHLERLRRRFAEGQSEIDRQRASVYATHEHMSGMSRWVAETDRQLSGERARRNLGGGG